MSPRPAQAVVAWERRRVADYEPHGTALVSFTVDARTLACAVEAGMVVRLFDVRSAAYDALTGTALGVTVRVPGFGTTCRHGTAVLGAPWARVRLVAPDDGAGGWVAVASGPWLGLPCCCGYEEEDEGAESEEHDMVEGGN